MGRQVFTAGEILTAANMNDLSDQTVMVFDDSAARAAAIPTPVEGMVTYLEDVGGAQGLEVFDGAAFTPVAIEPDPPAILQVVSTLKADVFSTTSTSFVDITGLTVTITPSSTSSKVLVFANVAFSRDNSENMGVELVRDSTPIGSGTASASFNVFAGTQESPLALSKGGIVFLDTPNTTSATIYKIRTKIAGGGTGFINRRGADTTYSTSSDITVMEVAG